MPDFTKISKFRQFCRTNGYLVEEEKDIPYGTRLEISDGQDKALVNFYHSGKVLVQGKRNALREKIESFLHPVSPLTRMSEQDHSGVDESGKGDYFGPLVVSGVFLPRSQQQKVQAWGVMDSKKLPDARVKKIAVSIKQNLKHHTLVFAPESYNRHYHQYKNLNKLLAYGHAEVITSLVATTGCARVISDKFGPDHLIPSYLTPPCRVDLTQVTDAERDPAVACASILARACFLDAIAAMSRAHGISFLKGASAKVKKQALAFRREHGAEKLHEVAKTHFKMF